MINVDFKPVTNETIRKCSCCGKMLNINDFKKCGIGHKKICIECENKTNGTSYKFKDFQSRELIEELRARGYKGTLTKTIVKSIKL